MKAYQIKVPIKGSKPPVWRRMIIPEVPIIVDASCCAGVTPESHETALQAMKACQIVIK